MFCHITQNWRGRPMVSREFVGNLIAKTTARQGPRIKAAIDENSYAKGVKVSDAQLAALTIERHEFHGEWHYRALPETQHVSPH